MFTTLGGSSVWDAPLPTAASPLVAFVPFLALTLGVVPFSDTIGRSVTCFALAVVVFGTV